MLRIVDKAVIAWAGLGLKLLGLGWRYVFAYWAVQLAGLAILIYSYGFWNILFYVIIPWNIVSALMMWRANKIDTQRRAEIMTNSIIMGMKGVR